MRLADNDHPRVVAQAERLTAGIDSTEEKLRRIFLFVRDDILFGFPPVWDVVPASDTLHYGVGYCNTKATLFLALCQAAGVPARLRTGLINLEIMRGIFPDFAFAFMPCSGAHSWIEVQLQGAWWPLDGYINDRMLFEAARRRLSAEQGTIGYSLAQRDSPASCRFDPRSGAFVHMDAVLVDHGPWSDLADYMASDLYPALNRAALATYPLLARVLNRRVRRLRAQAADSNGAGVLRVGAPVE